MNNLFHPIISLKKLRLFAVLIASILAFSACKKPTNGVGDSIQPEGDLTNASQTDTTTLSARTLKVDSVISDFYSNVMIGNYVDDDFGIVKTTAILQFIPSTSSPRYEQNFRIDSVVISLAYQNAIYGKNVPMYFNVREVLDNLDFDSSYFSNSKVQTNSTNLIKSGLEIQNPTPELAGSVSSSETPTLRVHLKHALGEKLLTTDTSILDDRSLFKAYFGGLAINSETIDAQVINFLQNNAATKLTVYYAELDEAEELLNSADFVISSSSCKAFTQIENQYQGTVLQPLHLGTSVDGNELCYLQSGQGTRVAIDISNAKWLNNYNGVTINRAELVIPYDKNSKFSPLSSMLVFYKPEGAEFFTYAETGGNVNVSTGLYRVNITNHLQKYLAGEILTDEILLQPVYTLSQFTNSWSVARSLLHGPGFNTEVPEQNMRLVITYSY